MSGDCYNAAHLALPNARHPYVDHIYISITCLYVFLSLGVTLRISTTRFARDKGEGIGDHWASKTCHFWSLSCVICANPCFPLGWCWACCTVKRDDEDEEDILRKFSTSGVLVVATLQYPLHVYSLFTLRANNEGSLTNGEDEKKWGFGQIVAMALLAANLLLLLNGIQGILDVFLRDSIDSAYFTRLLELESKNRTPG
jgi:hypothetical protein